MIDSVSDVLAQSDRIKVTYDPPADGPCVGRFVDLDRSSLYPDIVNWLCHELPLGLFTHQHVAVEQVLRGRHTVVSTRTSSGKSLIFGLPALHHLADDPKASSLLCCTLKRH